VCGSVGVRMPLRRVPVEWCMRSEWILQRGAGGLWGWAGLGNRLSRTALAAVALHSAV